MGAASIVMWERFILRDEAEGGRIKEGEEEGRFRGKIGRSADAKG